MSDYDFDNVLERLKDAIGSWAEMTRVCQKAKPKLAHNYWQRIRNDSSNNGKSLINPALAVWLEEAAEGAVKKEEMRPDVFLTPSQQREFGII